MSNWFFDGSFKWLCLLFGRKSHSTLSSVIRYIIITVLCILVGSPCFRVSQALRHGKPGKQGHSNVLYVGKTRLSLQGNNYSH
jgi:hypothetical protein